MFDVTENNHNHNNNNDELHKWNRSSAGLLFYGLYFLSNTFSIYKQDSGVMFSSQVKCI